MTRRQRVPASACARCGRALTADATMTPIGPVGPECATKLAGLDRFLAHFGLYEFMNRGSIIVEAQPVVSAEGETLWRRPEGLLRLERLAKRVGLELHQTVDWSREAPTITAELRVKDKRRFANSWRSA